MSGPTRTLYRAMIPDGDRPTVGTERNMLGLRAGEADLSVYTDYRRIMQPIRPRSVLNHKGQPGGNAETVLFEIEAEDLAAYGLKLGTVKPDTHGPVEPEEPCEQAETHRRVVATLPKWKKVIL